MRVPSPQELGLPEKFDNWRPVQEDFLATLITSSYKRSTAACAPTGSGKSAVLVGYAKYTGEPTCIVTQNKGLQNQYMEDYSEIGMVDIRGRNNYPCDMHDEFTCQEGYMAKCPYKGSINCPASQAEMRASVSPLVVTNYAKWTASKRYSQGMSHFTQVFFDEAHESPLALAAAMQVTLHNHEINDVLGMDFPKPESVDDMGVWKAWAGNAKGEAENEHLVLKDKISRSSSPRASWIRELTHMQNLVRNLTILMTCNTNNWVVDEIKDGYVFDPIRPGRYAEAMLFFRTPRLVFASATLREMTMRMNGLSAESYIFKEYNSDFDPKDCPIYYIPTQKVDADHPDMTRLWDRFDQIAQDRTDKRGLLHTISYARRDEIMKASRFADMMTINPRGEPPTETVDKFKMHSPMGSILASPSIGTGFDFKYDAAEWQFVCKIPFEPPSKVVKARERDSNGQYRGYRAAQILEQAFGRINRERGDRGESFICDDNMQWFFGKFGHFMSKTFHRRFRPVGHVPVPLRKM